MKSLRAEYQLPAHYVPKPRCSKNAAEECARSHLKLTLMSLKRNEVSFDVTMVTIVSLCSCSFTVGTLDGHFLRQLHCSTRVTDETLRHFTSPTGRKHARRADTPLTRFLRWVASEVGWYHRFEWATWGAICTFRGCSDQPRQYRAKSVRGVEKTFRFWGGQGLSTSH